MTSFLPITQTAANWLTNASGVRALTDRFVGGVMTFDSRRTPGSGHEDSMWFWNHPDRSPELGPEARRLTLREGTFALEVWSDQGRREIPLPDDPKDHAHAQNVFRNFVCAQIAPGLSDVLAPSFQSSRCNILSIKAKLGVETPISEVTPVYPIGVLSRSPEAARALIAGLSNFMSSPHREDRTMTESGIFLFIHGEERRAIGTLQIWDQGGEGLFATVLGRNFEATFSLADIAQGTRYANLLQGLEALTAP